MHTILLHPLHPDQLFVSNQSSTCYLMNMNGQVIKGLQSGKRTGGGEARRVGERAWLLAGCGGKMRGGGGRLCSVGALTGCVLL